MKLYDKYYTSRISALSLGILLMTSCQDEVFYSQDDFEINSDMLTFEAAVGRCVSSTRSEDTPSDIEPLELVDGENRLYLHTYVCDNGYDPTEFEPETSTRGLQVNDMPSLISVHTNFGVEANYADIAGFPHYISERIGEKVDESVWRPEGPVIYWPGDDAKLHFHAWAPAALPSALTNVNKEKNKVSFDYEAQKSTSGDTDAESQTDILWAINMGCRKSTSTNGRAELRFTHPLSAIKFAVRDVIGGSVKRISIKNVYSKGSCTYTAAATGEGTYTWTNHSGKSEFSQVFNVDFTPSTDKSDVSITDNKPEATFMMIPQTIEDDAVIEVEIEQHGVKNPDGSDAPNRTLTVRGNIKVDDVNDNPNRVTSWEAGKEYVYTISTTKDNWIYVFDAEGNEAESTKNIYVYSPSNVNFDELGNTAYFNVKSYRYKANDHTTIEPLPWTASHEGSYSYWVNGSSETEYPATNPDLKYVTSDLWITDNFATPLKGGGIGSHTNNLEKHELTFLPHYVSTDWIGDEIMQGREPYPGYDKENPYDLSKFGDRNRNTANCYIIDRGGWYMFPLVYGNAIKDNGYNTSAYICQNTSNDPNLKLLNTLTDYNDHPIANPYITVDDNAYSELLWQDAYDLVDEIELVTIGTEKMIRFYVESNDLQQGNAVIALKDGTGTVIWSWHIWATEHWIDEDTRLPHVYDTGNSKFNTYTPSAAKTDTGIQIGLRECGDVQVTFNQFDRTFWMAAYNLGWCDPKMVLYLKRKADMDFVQYMPDGTTPTKKEKSLPIIQAGETIDYKYANNTYYQWGRKDPIRGYFNHEHETKRVFGPRQPYMEKDKVITIGEAIKYPEIFYCSNTGEAGSPFEDWLTSNFKSNLWNNHSNTSLTGRNNTANEEDMWSHTKTVYDPSPAGYMIPNAGVWRVIQKNFGDGYTFSDGTPGSYGQKKYINGKEDTAAQRDTWSGGNWALTQFKTKVNGERIDDYNYKVWGRGIPNDNSNALFFSSTGNRWWTDAWSPANYNGGAGGNFCRNVSYAWSNRSFEGKQAYGMALGLDTDRLLEGDAAELRYYVGGQFIGRRTMGRPVRAIREP